MKIEAMKLIKKKIFSFIEEEKKKKKDLDYILR